METLGSRLKYLRRLKKLTQQQIADQIGVSKTSIIYWEKDENTPKYESLIALTKIFNVEANYLLNGKTSSSINDTKIFNKKELVPVLENEIINNINRIKNSYTIKDIKLWIPPHTEINENLFALAVEGESMLPDFKPKDFIYINPNFNINELKTGDFVISVSKRTNSFYLRKLIHESGKKYLQVINKEWPERTISLNDNEYQIVGKVIGLYRNYI